MATHSSTLAWKIPWTEEPGGLQSMGSLRVGHDWATSFSLYTFIYWRRKWQPTLVLLPGESQGWGAWWAAICGVAQSQTRLKWLSSSSSSSSRHFHPVGRAVRVLAAWGRLLTKMWALALEVRLETGKVQDHWRQEHRRSWLACSFKMSFILL